MDILVPQTLEQAVVRHQPYSFNGQITPHGRAFYHGDGPMEKMARSSRASNNLMVAGSGSLLVASEFLLQETKQIRGEETRTGL